MPKKNGFIAISIIYSFFLCFIMLMMGMLANYTHSKLILRKTNEPLIFEQDSHLTAKIMQKYPSRKTISDFSQGCPTSSDNSCSGLFQTVDDDGDSYYFRGAIDNNYLKLSSSNSNLWRIVRINGDGTIRLILDGDIGTSAFNTNYNERKYVGYTYGNNSACTKDSPCTSNYSSGNFKNSKGGNNSTIKDQLENWYKTNISSFDSKIALTTYCNDTSFGSGSETGTLYYGAYQRLSNSSINPQLKCPNPTQQDKSLRDYGGVYKLKIGLISADEIVLAGFKPTNSTGVTTSNYLYYSNASSDYFWSMSPNYSITNGAYSFNGYLNYRYLSNTNVHTTYRVRPVININGDVIATGDGTKDNPYIIK